LLIAPFKWDVQKSKWICCDTMHPHATQTTAPDPFTKKDNPTSCQFNKSQLTKGVCFNKWQLTYTITDYKWQFFTMERQEQNKRYVLPHITNNKGLGCVRTNDKKQFFSMQKTRTKYEVCASINHKWQSFRCVSTKNKKQFFSMEWQGQNVVCAGTNHNKQMTRTNMFCVCWHKLQMTIFSYRRTKTK
jgi:hypothetical protein